MSVKSIIQDFVIRFSFAVSCQSFSYSTTKTIEEKLGFPQPPKKPLTPFFRYLTSVRQQPENSKITAVEISRKWKLVDEALKNKLTQEFWKEKVEYKIQLQLYESKLTEDEKENIENTKRTLKQIRAEGREKRAYKKVR